ncbi:MAG: hypothetical protein HRU39_03355 [Salinicola sp.]|uniref:hypothetical protein n=1 Tax=Salinicola TaxID=404432 RepID=UPI0013A6741D|nr:MULTISPECIES: hypothetical protein [Salinicola]NRB55003.1 hypothetical protein [Salinicola sp.]
MKDLKSNMVTRRTVVKGLLVSGSVAAFTNGLGYGLQRLLLGERAFAASLRPLAIPPVLAGEIRDRVRTYDLGLQKGASNFYEGKKLKLSESMVTI